MNTIGVCESLLQDIEYFLSESINDRRRNSTNKDIEADSIYIYKKVITPDTELPSPEGGVDCHWALNSPQQVSED